MRKKAALLICALALSGCATLYVQERVRSCEEFLASRRVVGLTPERIRAYCSDKHRLTMWEAAEADLNHLAVNTLYVLHAIKKYGRISRAIAH